MPNAGAANTVPAMPGMMQDRPGTNMVVPKATAPPTTILRMAPGPRRHMAVS
jgi:hypothetical protein